MGFEVLIRVKHLSSFHSPIAVRLIDNQNCVISKGVVLFLFSNKESTVAVSGFLTQILRPVNRSLLDRGRHSRPVETVFL